MVSWDQTEAGDNDRQMKEVYAAERAVDWSAFGADDNLGELEDVWEYTYRLMRRQSTQRRFPKTYRKHASYKMKPRRWQPYGEQVYVMGEIQSDDRYLDMRHGLRITPKARGGSANGSEMNLDRWARQKWIVIHELAHVVDHIENGSPRQIYHQGHGWQFAAIYLRLVGTAFGYGAEKALRASFKTHGVKHSQPKTERTARHPKELMDHWVTGW